MESSRAVKESETEARAQAFVAENEPLLARASAPTLGRIILHGGEIATALSEEVVAEMEERSTVLNGLAGSINDPDTPPAQIQEYEEVRARLEAQQSTKQETFESLSSLMERAIDLKHEREEILVAPDSPDPNIPMFTKPRHEAKRGFWSRLFGGR